MSIFTQSLNSLSQSSTITNRRSQPAVGESFSPLHNPLSNPLEIVGQRSSFWSGSSATSTVISTSRSRAASTSSSVVAQTVSSQLAWAQRLGGLLFDGATSVATDAAGNVYVAGYTEDDGQNANSLVRGARPRGTPLNNDLLLAKYNSSGRRLWVRQLGDLRLNDQGNGIAIDRAGNVYVAGSTTGRFPSGALPANRNFGSSDAFLAKFNTNGGLLWTKQFGTSGLDRAQAVSIDRNGNIYVTGAWRGSAFGMTSRTTDAFLTRFTANGQQLWMRQLGVPSSTGFGVTVNDQGQIFITGDIANGDRAAGGAFFADGFVAKYSSNGTRLWWQPLGTSLDDHAYSIAADRTGKVYVTGSAGGFQGSAFLAAIASQNGEIEWAIPLQGASSKGTGVAVDRFNRIYVTGRRHRGYQGFDGFLAAYDVQGDQLWEVQTQQTNTGTQANGVAVDTRGGAYIVGVTPDRNAFLRKYWT